MSTSDVVALAKALIACPSVTPDDAGCQRIIQERLSPLGFQCETMLHAPVSNVWARYGTASPLLVFAGHTDVVPPGNLADWKNPPFLPEEQDGYLYGRGVADMKGALAAMIIAAERLIQKHSHLKGSLAFLITSDEEGPAIQGTQKVIEALTARGEKIDYCIVGEPCSNEEIGDEVMIGRRGSLHGKLMIRGIQGHIARPHLALNPIHASLMPLYALTQMVWDKGDAHFPPTSFQISNLHSGTGALNVIPGELTCLFNFRYAATSTPATLQARLESQLREQGLNFEISWSTGALPYLSCKGLLRDTTKEAVTTITGKAPRYSTDGGTSDGRFIAATGTEVIELGLSRKTAHHVNECVRVDDLTTLVEMYESIAEKILTS